jgi:hypothetical protein
MGTLMAFISTLGLYWHFPELYYSHTAYIDTYGPLQTLSLFCNSLIEGFGSGSRSIPLTNGSGSGRVDPDLDSDTDRNESTNVPILKLRIETKPKRFDVFQNLK